MYHLVESRSDGTVQCHSPSPENDSKTDSLTQTESVLYVCSFWYTETVFDGKRRMSISESDEISKNSDSPCVRTPKSTLRHDWSDRLQLEGRLSRLELEHEMTPFVNEADTDVIGVIRMKTAKTHDQRIVRPFARSF